MNEGVTEEARKGDETMERISEQVKTVTWDKRREDADEKAKGQGKDET